MDHNQLDSTGYIVTIRKSILPMNSISNLKENRGEHISRELIQSVPLLNNVISWFDRHIMITIQDSRRFVGILKAMDKICNLVLSDTIEFPAASASILKSRIIGLVVIPGMYITKIEEYVI